MMNLKVRLICFTYNLKIAEEKKYEVKEVDDNLVYLFENKEEYVNYFLDNGLESVSEGIINLCTYYALDDGQIMAKKKVCDQVITMLKKPKYLTFKNILEIHERGNLTPWEKVEEWLENGVCAPKDYTRCNCFYNCKECLVNYASNCSEYEPEKNKEKTYSRQLRKRDC